MYDELGVRYEAVTEDLPESARRFAMSTSRGRRSRRRRNRCRSSSCCTATAMTRGIQGESSGWLEVAAKTHDYSDVDRVAGATAQEHDFAAIGEAGTMAILDRLLAKYPQIDPSRVYFTGLSAGAMNSFNYGVNNIERIAGVEGHSAPFGPPALLDAARRKRSGQYLPMYAIAGNETCTSRFR